MNEQMDEGKKLSQRKNRNKRLGQPTFYKKSEMKTEGGLTEDKDKDMTTKHYDVICWLQSVDNMCKQATWKQKLQ